jgi:hypothetical protein
MFGMRETASGKPCRKMGSVLPVVTAMMTAKMAASKAESDRRSAAVIIGLWSVVRLRGIVGPWCIAVASIVAAVVPQMMTMMIAPVLGTEFGGWTRVGPNLRL